MPRVNIFIRKEDWDRWQAIPDVPEWIHKGLVGKSVADKEVKQVRVKTAKVIKTVAEAQASIDAKLDKLVDKGNKTLEKLCPVHRTPLDSRGKCLQKGCKYA